MKIKTSILCSLITVALLFISCSKSGDQQVTTPTPPPTPPVKPYIVSTYAGMGVPGFQDGPALSAKFRIMAGVAVDIQGIVYEADPDNNRIRKIALDSSVSTYAGTGVMGFNDGPVATAQFFKPSDVAVDGAGNLIVADIGNHRIRKITPAGMVSTVAGDGTAGYIDGNAASARFDQPNAVCIDATGNIYVSDMGNVRIRKISTSGVVSTIAGNGIRGLVNGNALTAEFNLPFDIDVDVQGNLYVADLYNCVIRKITSTGTVSTYAGTVSGFADGPAASAKFFNPKGLVLDPDGNLYIADFANNRIRKITSAGIVSTVAGKGTAGVTNGDASIAEFANPKGIAIDRNGVFFIGDELAYCIRKISK